MTWFAWLLLGWVLLSLPVALLTGRILRGLHDLQQRRGVLPRWEEVDLPSQRTDSDRRRDESA